MHQALPNPPARVLLSLLTDAAFLHDTLPFTYYHDALAAVATVRFGYR